MVVVQAPAAAAAAAAPAAGAAGVPAAGAPAAVGAVRVVWSIVAVARWANAWTGSLLCALGCCSTIGGADEPMLMSEVLRC